MSRKGAKPKKPGFTVPLAPSKKHAFIILTIAFVFTIAIFWQNLDDGLMVDDAPLIFSAKAFFPNHISNLISPDMGTYWRPFTKLTFVPEAMIWNYSPLSYHLTSLLLHLIVIWLLFIFAGRFLTPTWAAVSAGIFAFHPVHGGAVAWISARYDLLATVFVLAAVIFYLRHLVSMGKGNIIASILMMILGIFSKEVAFITPFLILLCGAFFGPSSIWQNLVSRYKGVLAFFIAGAFLVAVRWVVLGGPGGPGAHLGAPEVLSPNLGNIIANYLVNFPLIFMVPVNGAATGDIGDILKPLLFIIGLFSMLGIILFRNNRQLWVGLLFAMICCAPFSFFVSIGANLESSYMLYLPLVGFAVFIASVARLAYARGKIMGKTILIAFVIWTLFLPGLLFIHGLAHSQSTTIADNIRIQIAGIFDKGETESQTIYCQDFPSTHKGVPIFFDEIDQIMWPVLGREFPAVFYNINENFLVRHPKLPPFAEAIKGENARYLVWDKGKVVDKTEHAQDALAYLDKTDSVEKMVLEVVDKEKIEFATRAPILEISTSGVIPASSISKICLKLKMNFKEKANNRFTFSWIDSNGEYASVLEYAPGNDGNTCIDMDKDPRWALAGELSEMYLIPLGKNGNVELSMVKLFYKTQSIEIFEEIFLDANDPLLQTIIKQE